MVEKHFMLHRWISAQSYGKQNSIVPTAFTMYVYKVLSYSELALFWPHASAIKSSTQLNVH